MVDRSRGRRFRPILPVRVAVLLGLLGCVYGMSAQAAPPSPSRSGPGSFDKQIKPILHARCQGCHQPASAGGQLVLTDYAGLTKGGEHGSVFTAGKPDSSSLLDYLTGKRTLMPKG